MLAANRILNREDVLALDAARLMVGASAMGRIVIRADGVASLAGLRGNYPRAALANDF